MKIHPLKMLAKHLELRTRYIGPDFLLFAFLQKSFMTSKASSKQILSEVIETKTLKGLTA